MPMLQVSAEQLAELLVGLGRAQAAMVQGLESELAGVRSGRIIPAVQNVAHLRDHPNPTLVDLPVRILLGSMGRVGPDPATVAKELERLFVPNAPATGPAPTAAEARATAAAAAAPSGDEALDFSKPAG